MPASTGNYVWDAENVQKNVPQVLFHWRWRKDERKEEMVWLSLDRFSYLPDPGIFQYPFCMAGTPLLFYTAFHSDYKRQQSLLQQILRQRATVFPCRRKVRTVPEKGYSKMDEVSIFPVWIFNLFLCDVFPHAVEHPAGIRRRKKSQNCSNTAVDVQATLALGLPRHAVFWRDRTVCFRLLQRDAYLHRARIPYHGVIQTPLLVRVLPYGNHDAAYLQSQKRGGTAKMIVWSLVSVIESSGMMWWCVIQKSCHWQLFYIRYVIAPSDFFINLLLFPL